MPEIKHEIPNEQQDLEPRRCATLFDFFHLISTLLVSIQVALMIGKVFGAVFGVLAFILSAVVAFYVLGYAVAAFVLFLHRRYSPKCRIGYEAACYVLSHIKRDT